MPYAFHSSTRMPTAESLLREIIKGFKRKGILTILIATSGVILLEASVNAQENQSLSPSRHLEGVEGISFNGDWKTLSFDEEGNPHVIGTGGEFPGEFEYTQGGINDLLHGEGRGDELEGSSLVLPSEEKDEINEGLSSPGSLRLREF